MIFIFFCYTPLIFHLSITENWRAEDSLKKMAWTTKLFRTISKILYSLFQLNSRATFVFRSTFIFLVWIIFEIGSSITPQTPRSPTSAYPILTINVKNVLLKYFQKLILRQMSFHFTYINSFIVAKRSMFYCV